jgi:glycolate oxidase FAD binding subunit
VAVSPGSYEEVAAVISFANQRGLAVIPGEASPQMSIGNVPRRYDVTLSLDRLNKVVEYEAADLTVTCQAGTRLSDLQRELAENGQMAPFGSPAHDYSVGALVASNYSEQRLKYGSPRDFTIGMRVVTADGRITRAGGRVVKNVAGYDLSKLHIGSRGTLGIIVELTLKVVPRPTVTDIIDVRVASAEAACRFASAAYGRSLSLSALRLRGDGTGYTVTVEIAGGALAVERTMSEIEALAGEFGAESITSCEQPPREATDPDRLECRAGLLPNQLPDLISAFEQTAPTTWRAYPIEGMLSGTWQRASVDNEALLTRLRAVTSAVGGTLVVTHCPLELKRRIDVFGEPPASFPLMRRIKEQFDPNGILSPGRFVGRL